MAVASVLAEALESHRAGRADEAERLYRQALAEQPADPTALYLYGLFNFEAGRSDAAAALLHRVVGLRPDHAQARLTLAQLRHWRGEHEAAAADYRQALALEPHRADAAIGLANVLREAGQIGLALAEGEAVAAQFPKLVEAWVALGAVRLAARDAEGAAAAYEAAVALDPQHAIAHLGLAGARLALGDASGAGRAAETALAIEPVSADAWFVLGAALRAQLRTEAAVQALEQAAALAPERATIRLDLGGLYAEQGRAPEAEASLLVALALDPSSAATHASLSAVYLRAGREGEAERHARAAIVLDPDMAEPHQTLASVLAAQGWAAEARRHRDAAYRGRNLFVEPALEPGPTVLMPITAEAGNTPLRDVMPRRRIGRARWVIEYATAAQIAQPPPHDVVFNAIGDPDLAGPTAAPMRRFLRGARRPILNAPAGVAATRRDRLPTLLSGLPGVVTPPAARLTARVMARWGLAGAVRRAGLRPPLLLRPVGSHGGRGLVRIESMAELANAPLGGDLYATAFHEYRSADGAYRKYRVIFVDRCAYPYHLAISREWLVHYLSAGMANDADGRAEEARFLADPDGAVGAAAMEAVRAIGRRLDLDYAGVDFSVLDDGRVLVFEANATMLAHEEAPDGLFAYKNPAVAAITTAFERMLIAAATTGERVSP